MCRACGRCAPGGRERHRIESAGVARHRRSSRRDADRTASASQPPIISMPPIGRQRRRPLREHTRSKLPENSTNPQQQREQRQLRQSVRVVDGANAASARPLPNANTAAVCSRDWSAPCTAWLAYAASATAAAATAAPLAASQAWRMFIVVIDLAVTDNAPPATLVLKAERRVMDAAFWTTSRDQDRLT